jgi:fructose/tagatose bisphosphate aldolase
MPLERLHDLLADARRNSYALCYCESWNLESLQAVIEAAEDAQCPTVAGFNGGFLAHASRRRPEDLSFYAGFRLALGRARVPVAFLLNESTDLGQMREAIGLGFNAVMPDNEGFTYEAYRKLVCDVVSIARPAGVFVEAQAGTLPAGHAANSHGEPTDPELARAFVADTAIDALGISVGNVHILTEGKCRLDLAAIERIRDRVEVPLVLHGGTGVAEDDLKTAIRAGVAKVNFGTVLKQVYLDAVRAALGSYRFPASPHEFLGIGGPKDILTAGRDAVRNKARELMSVCGSVAQSVR